MVIELYKWIYVTYPEYDSHRLQILHTEDTLCGIFNELHFTGISGILIKVK